jgi:hypothetical protein
VANSAKAAALDTEGWAMTSQLAISQRLPRLHIEHALLSYNNAWAGYASDAPFPRLQDAVDVLPAEGAIDGDVQFDVTLISHPIAEVLQWSDSSVAGIIFRRSVDVMHLAPLLTARGVAHQASGEGGVVTPRVLLMAKLRAIANTQMAGDIACMEALLDFLPADGIPLINLDRTYASCIRVLASELPAAAPFDALLRHSETRFSPENCARVWLLTAHASKGQTFARTYIGQSQYFPLERAINEGGISLSQEPRVEYVALTRSTRSLCYLRIVDAGDENGMEVPLISSQTMNAQHCILLFALTDSPIFTPSYDPFFCRMCTSSCKPSTSLYLSNMSMLNDIVPKALAQKALRRGSQG